MPLLLSFEVPPLRPRRLPGRCARCGGKVQDVRSRGLCARCRIGSVEHCSGVVVNPIVPQIKGVRLFESRGLFKRGVIPRHLRHVDGRHIGGGYDCRPRADHFHIDRVVLSSRAKGHWWSLHLQARVGPDLSLPVRERFLVC